MSYPLRRERGAPQIIILLSYGFTETRFSSPLLFLTSSPPYLSARYADHGPIFLEGGVIPTWANSLVVGKDGYVYFLANLPKGYRPSGSTDLMRVPDPHAEKVPPR